MHLFRLLEHRANDKRRYKRRNRIVIMFGRVKDQRPVAKWCDRCSKFFLLTIALAALAKSILVLARSKLAHIGALKVLQDALRRFARATYC